MLARVLSAAVTGIDAAVVSVEVDVTPGLPAFNMVGLPDSTIRESRDRVRSAIRNAGYTFPMERITVSLAPADLRKEGAAFDLPIALGILAATGLVKGDALSRFLLIGELSLDGEVHPVRGVLPIALACRREGLDGLLLPAANCREAAVVGNLTALPLGRLSEAVEWLSGERAIEPARVDPDASAGQAAADDVDFSEVRGQAHAKRALEIAAAGGHNVLMIGALPGAKGRHPPPGEKAMEFEHVPAQDDRVHQGPQEPLAPLCREPLQPPEGQAAVARHSVPVGGLGGVGGRPLAGLGQPSREFGLLALKAFEALLKQPLGNAAVQVEVEQTLALALEVTKLAGQILHLRENLHLTHPERPLVGFDLFR